MVLKINFLLIICISLLSLCPIHGQISYLEKKYKADAEEYIRVLKNEDKSSSIYKTSLERAITNYRVVHYYAIENIPELFELIFESTHQFKNEYYRFLLLDAEYFSASEVERIKLDLQIMLDKSDYQFYDIVSLYHLDAYKSIIAAEKDTTFYSSLRNAFKPQYGASHGLSEKNTRRYTTLANLGETSIEDSIIQIINQLYAECQNTEDTLKKNSKYLELFYKIVPKILGKLNSKKSVERTIYMVLDEYVLTGPDGYSPTWPYEQYVQYIILPKVTNNADILGDGIFKVETGQMPLKTYLESIYNRIKNNEVIWKKTLVDVD